MMNYFRMDSEEMGNLGNVSQSTRRLFHTSYLVLVGIVALGSCLIASAQVDLPRIMWHPSLEDYVSTSIIDDFRNNPLEEVKGVQLNFWTFPDCLLNRHPYTVRYQDIPGILNEGYTLGTFTAYDAGIAGCVNVQIQDGARIVVVDEPWGYGTQQLIDLADYSHQAGAGTSGVFFAYSDVNFGDRIHAMCEQAKALLAAENPPRQLSDIFDAIVMQTSWDDADVDAMASYAQQEGIKCGGWVYTGTSGDISEHSFRKVYYQLSSLFIFQIPSHSGWLGSNGMRQHLVNMVDSRFVIRSAQGTVLAAFDRLGYLTLTVPSFHYASSGQLTPSSTTNEFIVRTPSTVLALLDETGMYLKGSVFPSLTTNLDQVTGTDALRVKNANGQTVAMITAQNMTNSQIQPYAPYTVPAGSLLLKGELVE